MAVGEVFSMPWQRQLDARTGRALWQLSHWPEAHCAATYMYFQAVTADDRQVVFASDRTGQFELYLSDRDRGTVRQLTERELPPGHNPKGALRSHLLADRREVLYCEGPYTRAVHIDTLAVRTVAGPHPDDPFATYRPTNILTGDGRDVLFCFVDRQGREGFGLTPLDGSNTHRVLFTMPDASLTLAHLTCAPGPELVIAFNIVPDRQNDPAQAHDLRARCWGYRGATGEVFNLLTMPPGWRATHETWSRDRRLYFHRKAVPNWTPTRIASVNERGEDYRDHFLSPDRKLGHSCVSPDLRWLVSDVQDTAGNELYLVDLATGAGTIVCWPDARTLDGATGHVHPLFSPSSRGIVFTSDRTGKAAVFFISLEDLHP